MRTALHKFSWLSFQGEGMCFSNKCEGCWTLFLFTIFFKMPPSSFSSGFIHDEERGSQNIAEMFRDALSTPDTSYTLEKPKCLSVFSEDMPKHLIWFYFHISFSTLSCWVSECWCPGLANYITLVSLCVKVKVLVTLCNPVDCSPPGSSVRGILQARILEWVATPFSRGISQFRDRT